ncbi:exocyst complex component 7 [Echinococcus multilocularis]|uniref:Exocyst complex component 7 n=1 Tax=Echinococcus multilocularis TaxID=6211 RepID=A0A068Y494_ECHMU|nr:exocyst complex component 7 [Echinococcus multilocularis]
MTTLMNYIPSQISQILAIRDKFVEISKQSDEKLTAMIEAAKDFRSGMEPLKKEVDQLQTRVKNLQCCIEGLSHVQNFYKTGREVEQTIIQGPSASLTNYLQAMDRIKDSLVYFNQNNTEHLEYTRLSTLLSNGLKSLHKYFDDILSQSFTPMPSDVLYRLAEKEDAISLDGTKADEASTVSLECDLISEECISNLQEISTWLRKATSLVTSTAVASTEAERKSRHHLARMFRAGVADSASTEGYQLPPSLTQYCVFRKDLMRVTLVKLREYQKTLENNAQNPRGRPGSTSSQLNISTTGKRRGLKAVGIVWDANSRRGVANDIRDVDDLDSEHYTTSLSGFLILVERERLLLDRLKLAVNSHEAHFAYSLICRSSLADLMTEGGSYVRLMSRVIGRGEFYMLVSLLTIMRRFVDLSPSFVETFKIVSTLSQPMTDLVNRFRAQIKVTLDAFLQQLQPGTGSSQVPPDATVHELTSNVLLFLEKLIDYEIMVGTALTWEEARITPETTFPYLVTVNSKPKMSRSAFGQYIFRVITSLVANIDKKSEVYSEDLSRVVFQMNNLRYILTNLKRTGLQSILDDYDNSVVDKFTRILNESKQVYTRACMRFINLPSSAFMNQFAQRRQMDSKERSQVKDIWNGINQGFASLLKQHSQLSIPDKELREDLRECLSRELVTLYQAFHDRSLQTPFTSRREKYIKLSPSEFQAKLDQMFLPAAAQIAQSRS